MGRGGTTVNSEPLASVSRNFPSGQGWSYVDSANFDVGRFGIAVNSDTLVTLGVEMVWLFFQAKA